MIIYADQMFFENFIMNYIILYMTAKLCGIEFKWYKLSIGAAIGAMYVIFSYIFLFYNDPFIIGKVLLSVVIVYSSFFPRELKRFLKLLICFYMITFFIGGISFGLAYFFNVVTINEGGILYVEEFPVIIVAIGSCIAFILGKYIFTFLKTRKKMKEFLYKLKIKLLGKTAEIDVLYDSGHSVREPFTNYPVVIVEKEAIRDIVTKDIYEAIKSGNSEIADDFKSKVRIVPISTVSSDREVLIGFKADECYIYKEKGEEKVKNAIIAICDKKLSKDGSYAGLIGDH